MKFLTELCYTGECRFFKKMKVDFRASHTFIQLMPPPATHVGALALTGTLNPVIINYR